jgi:anti-anti-sigma factor
MAFPTSHLDVTVFRRKARTDREWFASTKETDMQFPDQVRFEAQVEPRGDSWLIQLAGEFDLAAKETFEVNLSKVLSAKPQEVILDLRDVLFIDSTGLRLMLEAWKESRRAGFEFAVLKGDGQVSRILQETGLDQTLPCIPTHD